MEFVFILKTNSFNVAQYVVLVCCYPIYHALFFSGVDDGSCNKLFLKNFLKTFLCVTLFHNVDIYSPYFLFHLPYYFSNLPFFLQHFKFKQVVLLLCLNACFKRLYGKG